MSLTTSKSRVVLGKKSTALICLSSLKNQLFGNPALPAHGHENSGWGSRQDLAQMLTLKLWRRLAARAEAANELLESSILRGRREKKKEQGRHHRTSPSSQRDQVNCSA